MEFTYPPSMPDLTIQTPASTWRGLRFEWLWVYRAAAASPGRWTQPNEVPCGVFFVEKGYVELEAAGRRQRVEVGEAYFSAPGLRRHYFRPGTRLLSVGFRAQRPDGLSVFGKNLNRCLPAAETAALRAATLRLYASVHGPTSAIGYRRSVAPRPATLAARAAHEGAFFAWLAAYAHTLAAAGLGADLGQSGNRRLEGILAVLDEVPMGQRLAYPALAKRTGYGRRRLDQLMQAGLGLTMKGYLDRRRLESARRWLREGERPLKEIALSLGFRQPSHFTAWFRAGAGRTPSGYRADARQL